MVQRFSRRRALALAGTVVTGSIAGCGSDGGGDDPTGYGTDPDNGGGGPGGTGGETGTPTAADPGGSTPTEGGTTTLSGETAAGDGETPTDSGTTGTSASDSPALSDLSLAAERVASGFTSPVAVAVPRPGRRFVVDQAGQVYLVEDGTLLDDPFLDVTDRMVGVSGYSEQGLLGLAFHPEFEDNGRLFVRYSAPNREGTPGDFSHTFVLSEFRADPGADRADPDSERTILEIPQPQGNHNAGDIAFGPDGSLYVAVGDGGAADDRGPGHVADWYDAVDGGNGQDVTENLLGSILRIDVDGEPSASDRGGTSARNYAIPDDNPLVGTEGLDEHYAWGLRNPWRFSFGPEGRMFVADVGQRAWEEVNVVERGGNYGWNVMEGTHCFDAEECPDESPSGRPLREPVIEYPHGGDAVSGVSVIGGYLYDGSALSDFRGRYVFADWQAEGRLFVAEEADDGRWPTATVGVEAEAEFGPNVLSFGRDPDGELLVCTTAQSRIEGSSGALYRLRPP
jgi:glucose/arabinose dehydrogenase